MRSMRRRLWVAFGLSGLALLAAIGTGFYGGWGPCGPATIEGMLFTVGILGVLGTGVLLIGTAVRRLAHHVFRRCADT
jgi:hypothetical protein